MAASDQAKGAALSRAFRLIMDRLPIYDVLNDMTDQDLELLPEAVQFAISEAAIAELNMLDTLLDQFKLQVEESRTYQQNIQKLRFNAENN